MSCIYILITLFFSTYNVPLKILGGIGSSKFILLFGFLGFLKIKGKIFSFFKKDCILLFILLLVSGFYTVVAGENDFSYTRRILILLIEHYFFNYFFIYWCINKFNLSENKFKKQMVVVCILQSILFVLMFLFKDFKELIYSFLNEEYAQFFISINNRYHGIRGFGLVYNSVWDFSLIQSFALIILCSIFPNNTKKISFFYLVGYLLIVFSIFTSGRTGFIGIILSLFIIIFNIKELYLFLGFFFSGIIGFLYTALILKNRKIYELYLYAFEIINNFIMDKSIKTTSTDILINKMLLKLDWKDKILGYGRYIGEDGKYFMHTDAGYIRHTLYFGILAYFIYFLYIRFFIKMFKFTDDKLVIFLILISVFIAQIKGDLLLDSYLIEHFIFSFYFIIRLNRKIGNRSE
ncbi:MAG: hypothetical protein ACRC6E_03320 [Fusobacteriaceae bacterium]